jgi:hypothetical protein
MKLETAIHDFYEFEGYFSHLQPKLHPFQQSRTNIPLRFLCCYSFIKVTRLRVP